MSLDVYLIEAEQHIEPHRAIFIRDGGQSKEVTREEWDARNPGREPVTIDIGGDDGTVHTENITHNLNTMADEAGIYKHLWRPDEIGVTKATQLVEPLDACLRLLRSDRTRFEKFNPSNGWGNYDLLVGFIERYLEACRENPDAAVEVSR